MGRQTTPVIRRVETVVRNGRPRRECWGATSRDGRWCYERAADPTTRWYVIHNPTGWTITGGHGSLPRARAATASADALLDLWVDAHRELGLPDDRGHTVTNHDRARAVLTWLADHEPVVLAAAELLGESSRLRAAAGALLDVSTDLVYRRAGDDPAERDRNEVLAQQTFREATVLVARADQMSHDARLKLAG
jgi:hypothetical protein